MADHFGFWQRCRTSSIRTERKQLKDRSLMGSKSTFFFVIKLITCVSLSMLCCIQGHGRSSNEDSSPPTTFEDGNSSTTRTELPQNNDQLLHGGIIAFILLGCIVAVVLLGLFLTVVYLRKRNSAQYPLKWEKKFEESMGSFEMLDRETAGRPPTGRRERGKNFEKAGANLIHKCELETIL